MKTSQRKNNATGRKAVTTETANTFAYAVGMLLQVTYGAEAKKTFCKPGTFLSRVMSSDPSTKVITVQFYIEPKAATVVAGKQIAAKDARYEVGVLAAKEDGNFVHLHSTRGTETPVTLSVADRAVKFPEVKQ